MTGGWQVTAMTIVAGFVLGWTINGWRLESREADAIKKAVAEAEQKLKDYQATSADLETQLAELRKNERKLNRRLAHETRLDAYRCPLPADGVQLLVEARAADPAPGKPDSALPTAQ